MQASRIAAKRLSLLPERIRTNGPRNGAHLEATAQKVGDVWWKCGNEVAKILYKKIDERYADRMTSRDSANKHKVRMDDAKRILQENRNEVFEAVLPLFHITLRDGGDTTEADQHAHDYLVKNLFSVLVSTYLAWADELAGPHDAEATKTLVRNIGDVQRERLEGMLLNFAFHFRPVIARTPKDKV